MGGTTYLIFIPPFETLRLIPYIIFLIAWLIGWFLYYREGKIHFARTHLYDDKAIEKSFWKVRKTINYEDIKELGIGSKRNGIYVYIINGDFIDRKYDNYGFIWLLRRSGGTKLTKHEGTLITFLLTPKSLDAIQDIYEGEIVGYQQLMRYVQKNQRLRKKWSKWSGGRSTWLGGRGQGDVVPDQTVDK